MKERGRGLKPTPNEFMESVLETRWEMMFHNTLGAFHLRKKPENFGGSKSGISDW